MNVIRVLSPPPPLLIKSFNFKPPKTLKCRCSSSSSDGNEINDLKDALRGMVGEQVEELLNREENKVLLDGLEKASQRVEIAKRELALIQKQELAVKQYKEYIQQLEGNASKVLNIKCENNIIQEIVECQREILEAKAMIEDAERNLSPNAGGSEEVGALLGMKSEEIDRDEERWESVRAASISALVGTFTGLPICFTQVTNITQLLLPLAINFICCALFGVTFRYTIRQNLNDIQLKTGVAAAFGVVKGLATLSGGPLLELNYESLLSHAWDGTIYVSENLFIFVSAAVALDYCFKTRLLSTFPIDKSV